MIILTNVEGISRLSGTDEFGNTFAQFEVDYFADQENGQCAECGSVLSNGWMNQDGGEEYCDEHIVLN